MRSHFLKRGYRYVQYEDERNEKEDAAWKDAMAWTPEQENDARVDERKEHTVKQEP